jgi:hypothetical protein
MLLELVFLIMMRKQGNRWGKKKNSFVCWWNFHGSRIPIPAVGKERLQCWLQDNRFVCKANISVSNINKVLALLKKIKCKAHIDSTMSQVLQRSLRVGIKTKILSLIFHCFFCHLCTHGATEISDLEENYTLDLFCPTV